MSSTYLSLFFLTLASSAVLSPNPNLPLPIELSVTNVNTVASYWFNFQTPVQLDSGTYLYIQFPAEFGSVTTTACTLIKNFHQTTLSTTPCTNTVSSLLVQVTIPITYLAGALFTVQLDGVNNPIFITTTGPFSVWTKTVKDSQFTSQNMMFGTLAFTALLPNPSSLSAYVNTTATGYNNVVATASTYTFNVKWDYWIDAGAWFLIVLPSGWTKTSGIDNQCSVTNFTSVQVPPTGPFFCQTSGQNVYVEGLTSSIDPSNPVQNQFSIVIPNVVNPPSSQSQASSQFFIKLLDLGTNNVLELLEAYTPAIVPGTLGNIQVLKMTPVAKDMNGNQLVLQFSFTTASKVAVGGQVVVTLPQSTFVTSFGCAIISGITDTAAGNFATCAVTSQTITVANFALISPGATIVLQGVVSISATDTETIIISTQDSSLNVIDSGSFVAQRNYPNFLFSQFGPSSITFSGTAGTVSGTVVYSLTPTLALAPGSNIYLTLPPGFSITTLTCQQNAFGGGGVRTLTSCIYNVANNMVSLNTLTDTIPISQVSTFTLGGVTYPLIKSNYQNIYEFCATTFILGTTQDYNHQCTQVSLSEPTIVAPTTFTVDTSAPGVYQGCTLTFQTPTTLTYSSTVTPQVIVYLPMIDTLATSNGWYPALGVTGNVYCSLSGSASSYGCSVTNASSQASGFALFTFSMYTSMVSSIVYTARTILMSPQTASKSFQHKIEVGYLQNRIWKVVGSMQQTITTIAVPAAWTTNSFTSYSTTTILLSNTITTSITSPVASAGTWSFYYIFPSGWTVTTATSIASGTVTCTNLELMSNGYAPMIRCISSSAALVPNAATTLKILGLVNPGTTTLGTGQALIAGYFVGGVMQAYGASTTNLAATTAAAITTASVTPDILQSNARGVNYVITFTTVHSIPNNGLITLAFPTQYSGLMSNYQCVFGSNISGYNGASVSCVISAQTITVSALATVAAGTSLTITVRRINNPSLSTVTGFYITTAQTALYTIDRSSGLSVSFPTAFTQGYVYYGSITLEPNNAGAQYADFFMTFKPQDRIPEGATVQITIPFDFVDLASTGCSLNYMMASCTAAGHYINFVAAQDIPAASVPLVSVNQAFTIPLAQTSYFSIVTTYGGLTIDQSSASISGVVGNTFTPIPAAQTMTITSIDFFPTNQGEPATFTFTFSIPRTLLSTYSIIIWFPNDFDPSINTLNSGLQCWGNPVEFVGSLLNCQVGAFRKVTVSGLMTIPANFQFSVSIGGVLNPVTGKIGQFRFAVQDATGTTLNYVVNSGNFSIGPGPNPMKFKILTYANNQLRATNTLTFNFSPATNIPSSDDQGQIFIDFPAEYPLMNVGDQTGWQLPCSTWLMVNNVNTTNWNNNIQCINYNSNRVVITGGLAYTALSTQTISIQIQQVPGPQIGINSRNFKIMTYDGVKEVFLDRNYGQLSYVDSYQFSLVGEDLIVNSGNVVNVMRGTCSSPLTIATIDPLHPMRVDLQLTGLMPRVLTSRLSPSSVLTFKTSQPTLSFCIAVPSTLTPGTYNMQWSKTGDDYYLDSTGDEIYAPLSVTQVTVNMNQATVSIGQMSNAVAGGHSLQITVTLSNSPYNELILTPTQVGTIDPSITFDPPTLQFGPSDLQLDFLIRANTLINKTNYEISWRLDGTDASAYIQPSDSFFNVLGSDEIPPLISSARYTSTRTSAQVYVTGNKQGILYYQLQLQNTPTPTAPSLLAAFSLGHSLRQTLFLQSQELLLTFPSLAAETNYVFFVTLEDPSGSLAQVTALNITTLPDYQSVKFVIDFDPNTSVTHDTSTIQTVLAPEVARALSITPGRVTMYNVALDAMNTRRLTSFGTVDVTLYSLNAIVVVIANDKFTNTPSPSDLVTSLTITTLNSYLNKHGVTVLTKSVPILITNGLPVWQIIGNIWQTDGFSITCAGSLTDIGYIHMVVLDAGSPAPSSQQIAWGLDGNNKVSRHAFVYYSLGAALANATFSGLEENTRYDVYVTATSGYPGNNKAVSDSPMTYLGVRTNAIYNCTTSCPLYFVANFAFGDVLGIAGMAMILSLLG